MELIKKTMSVEDAKGWYLTQNEKRYWMEDFVDEDDGSVCSVERNEIICERGAQLNELLISLLVENDVKTVRVSNIPIKGNQEKYMNLWEVILKVTEKVNPRKRSYIVTADSPTAAEAFISEYFEINIEADFELVKVNQTDYNKLIKMYETEREAYEADGKRVKWYKCQIYSMIDAEDGESQKNAGSKNILVQAKDFERAIEAVKAVLGRNEFDSVYSTLKLVQELTVLEVFIPDESVSYYSNEEL
jgi:hypothetical protein